MAKRLTTLPLSVYVEGNSIIHRMKPTWKIAILITFIIASTLFFHTLVIAGAGVALVIMLYAVARIPIATAFSQVWPPLIILVPLAGFQWWSKNFTYAALMFLTLLAAMLLAFLLTLTSTVEDIMASLEKGLQPLQRLGLPVDTISLAMALTIRLIPLMFETVYDVLDARKARGAHFSIMALTTPVIIRSIRRARAMGEALHARGVGD